MPRTATQILPVRAPITLVQRLTQALTQALSDALARRRDRTSLARLDAHLLRDIGLSPDAARTECAKPFWRS